MKKFKKIILSFALLVMVSLCPVLIGACGENNTPKANENGVKMANAVAASLEVLEAHKPASTDDWQETETVDENANFVMLYYIEAIMRSTNFDYPQKAFKSTVLQSKGALMDIDCLNEYKLDEAQNKVSVKFYFQVRELAESTDYSSLDINYDFDTKTLVSFEWKCLTTYTEEEQYFHCKYESENDQMQYFDDQDGTDKTQTTNERAAFIGTEDLESKIYDFTKEYLDTYNKLNPQP